MFQRRANSRIYEAGLRKLALAQPGGVADQLEIFHGLFSFLHSLFTGGIISLDFVHAIALVDSPPVAVAGDVEADAVIQPL